MSTDMPDEAETAFEDNQAFDLRSDGAVLATTVFNSTVRAAESEGPSLRYVVTIYVPTFDTATEGVVGLALEESWQETLTRRLEGAPKATRASVELDAFDVEDAGDELRIEYTFTWGNPTRAVEIAKTFAEYVEGTYVEGIIPGYDYRPPVSSLLADASQSGEGGTPL